MLGKNWNLYMKELNGIINNIWLNIIECEFRNALKQFEKLISDFEEISQQFPEESKELVESSMLTLTGVEECIKEKDYMQMSDLLYYELRPIVKKYIIKW